MRDLNLIIDLQERLKSLNIMYRNLEKLIEQLSSVINNKEFIPEQLKESIHDMLSSISDSQSEFVRQYSTLEIGDLAMNVLILDETLEKCRVSLSEKDKFKKIVDYVMGLYSTHSDVNDALQKEKGFLSSFNVEDESIERCKELLGKYFVLKETIGEPDSKKRFDLAFSGLIGSFDKDIIFGITNSVVFFKEAESGTQEQEKETVFSANTETGSVDDNTELDKSAGEQQHKMAVVESSEVINEAPTEESVTEEVTNFTDYSATTEEKNDDDNWKELDIQNPSIIKYDVDDSLMKVNTSPKSKKFSASSFKKEIRSDPYGVEMKFVLKHAFEYYGMVPATFAALCGTSIDDIKKAADKLVKAGYLSEYELLKKGFDVYHSYYALTSTGVKVFRSKEASSILQIKHNPSASLIYKEPISAGNLLARLLAAISLELVNKTGVENFELIPPHIVKRYFA